MNKICGFCKNKMTIKLGTEDSNFTFYTYDCKLCANSYDVSYRQLINKETDQLLGVTFGIEEFYVILNFDLYPVYQEAIGLMFIRTLKVLILHWLHLFSKFLI